MNSNYLIIISFLLLGTFDLGQSQLSQIQQCPSPRPKSGLKQKDISGTWYEQKRYPTSYVFGTCVSIKIDSGSSGDLSVTTNQSYPGLISTPQTVTFNKHKKSSATEGLFLFRLSMGLVAANATLTVVDTDYKNWISFSACGTFFNYTSVSFAWIYTRGRNVSNTIVQDAMNSLTSAGINTQNLVNSVQTNC